MNKIFNFIVLFVAIGVCLVVARECESQEDRYQQTREEIIARTMAELQAEEEWDWVSDEPPVLVVAESTDEIPSSEKLVPVNLSQSSNRSMDQEIRDRIITQTMSDLQSEADWVQKTPMFISGNNNEADFQREALRPRFEANWRYSEDRSILMGEFWLPLKQCHEDSVFFCDIRFMGDENDNQEFNVGLGYREVLYGTFLGEGIAGAMVWFDRRFTKRDSRFNQITVGGEWLGEQFDLRLNGYVPLDKKRIFTQVNPNGAGDGFVGNQILVNTDQIVVEEALPGIDFEVGSQLNFMKGITDSTRFFIGGYHFEGDVAEDITGVRTRIVSDITSDVQLGARFQHDHIRGSQTYIESTIRFPFGHKKKYKHEGYWSRLDESPERDIDVVSNEGLVDDGINKILLNAKMGATQNVIHVDNTAAVGGNGSMSSPYNTLAAAEGVATANDMIYVHRGDGTTTGQSAGIILDEVGQMLVGSGTDLLHDLGRFQTSNGLPVTDGIVLDVTTTAAVITNTVGGGVYITGDDVFVSGITIDGALHHGVYAINADNVVIDNVISKNNVLSGISVDATGSDLNKITFTNNDVDNNGIYGLAVKVNAGAEVGVVDFLNNRSTNATSTGIRVQVNDVGSTVGISNFMNNTAEGNGSDGLVAHALLSGKAETVNFTSNTSVNNGQNGLRVYSLSDGDIGTTNFSENTATNNAQNGIFAHSSGSGSTLSTANFTNNQANANTQQGLYALAISDGDIDVVNFTGNSANQNSLYGFQSTVLGVGSTITTTNFTNNTADSNLRSGFLGYAVSGGEAGTFNFVNNFASNNANEGLYALATGAGSTITTANFVNNTSLANRHGLLSYALTGGDIINVNFTGNISTKNANHGIFAKVTGAGSAISKVVITNNIAAENRNGLYFLAETDGDIVQVVVEGNTSRDNIDDGIGIDDNSVAGGIGIDLGGGVFGSTGKNRVYDNVRFQLNVDLDGAELKAENNWWGSISGLDVGQLLLFDGSTADTTPFLTADPSP